MTVTEKDPVGRVAAELDRSRRDHGVRPQVGELVFALALLALGVLAIVDSLRLPASISASGIGADLMPKVAGGFLTVVAVVLAVGVLLGNRAEPDQAEGEVDVSRTRWLPLVMVVAVIVAYGLILELAGFVIASALTFWGVTFAMGSRRFVLDPAIGLVLSAVIFVGFVYGLGIDLPSGVLEGVLPRG